MVGRSEDVPWTFECLVGYIVYFIFDLHYDRHHSMQKCYTQILQALKFLALALRMINNDTLQPTFLQFCIYILIDLIYYAVSYK